MRPGGTAGRPDETNDLADLHDLADPDIDLGEMAVAGCEAIAVIDLDHAAVAAGPAGRDDLAVGGDANGIAARGAEVEPGVHRGPAQERIAAHAEAGGEFDLADDRLAIGHECEGAVEAVHLGAGAV